MHESISANILFHIYVYIHVHGAFPSDSVVENLVHTPISSSSLALENVKIFNHFKSEIIITVSSV